MQASHLKIELPGKILIESSSSLKLNALIGFNQNTLFTKSNSDIDSRSMMMGAFPIFPDRKKDKVSKVIWRTCRFESFWENNTITPDDVGTLELLRLSCSSYMKNLRYFLILTNLEKEAQAKLIGEELQLNFKKSFEDLVEFTHSFSI